MRLDLRTAPVGCALLAAALALGACSRGPAGAEPAPRAGAGPVPVLAARVATANVPVLVQAIGTVQPFSLVSIRSQITGPITKVHFHEGQEVKAGDLLFTLDPRPWQAARDQARANLQRDQAELVSTQLEFQRTSNLFGSKIASRSDYDTAQAGYEAMRATVDADTAAMSNAQINLGYTQIRSPINGRTGNLAAKTGNVVKSPDDVLVTLAQLRPIYVAFAVPEDRLPAIREEARRDALPVTAVVPGGGGELARGRLTFIDNQVDTNTGTILLKATFANTNEVLWPGQFVNVSLTLKRLPDVTVVPTPAVQTGQDGQFVFVVKPDMTVAAQPVQTSIAYDGQTVITSGLKPGETVVTDGQLRLVPGAKVSVKPADATGLSGD